MIYANEALLLALDTYSSNSTNYASQKICFEYGNLLRFGNILYLSQNLEQSNNRFFYCFV